MKKLSIALITFGCISSALAAFPAGINPTEVSVPLLPGGFEIGVQGSYLQGINYSGVGDYVAFSTSDFNSPAQIKNIDPDFDWGWGANIGYIFPGTGNDVNLRYFHFGFDDTASVGPGSASVPGGLLGTVFLFASAGAVSFNGSSFLTASVQARQESDLNQVDLTAGQWINIGYRLRFHPIAGLRYADIDYKLNTNDQTIANVVEQNGPATGTVQLPISIFAAQKSDYQGLGPLVGMDASYYLGNGFGLVGHFNTALLVGDVDSKLNSAIAWPFTRITFGPEVDTIFAASSQSEFKTDNLRIVPNIDAKLGLDYTFLFNNNANSALTLELGYQVAHYFNAIDLLETPGTVVISSAGVVVFGGPGSSFNFNNVLHKTADFGFQGPYANLTLHI